MTAITLNLPLVSLSAQGSPAEFREVHLGMEVRVLLSASDTMPFAARSAAGDQAARSAFERIDVLDRILSDWRATSELRRLEAVPRDRWIDVSVELATVLALAVDVARATNGRFDPTIGPLTRLWREAARTGRPIDDGARAAARRRVDVRALEVDTAARRVRFRRDSMALDLGAIAKGFIVDEALAVLRRAGVPAALIEAGGDIAAFGAPIGASGWRVTVPRQRGDTVIVLTDGAISSSGDAAQHIVRLDGTSESHVVSPHTGYGMADGRTVTVVGARAVLTDAMATALSLVPGEAADGLAAHFGVRVLHRGATPASGSR